MNKLGMCGIKNRSSTAKEATWRQTDSFENDNAHAVQQRSEGRAMRQPAEKEGSIMRIAQSS